MAARELCGIGIDAGAVKLDVTDRASVSLAAKTVESEMGRLEVLVNNAGLMFALPPRLPKCQ